MITLQNVAIVAFAVLYESGGPYIVLNHFYIVRIITRNSVHV